MLPKAAYSKVVQSLAKMRKNWEEDRKEKPNLAPYEIDNQLSQTIEREAAAAKVRFHGREGREALVKETDRFSLPRLWQEKKGD